MKKRYYIILLLIISVIGIIYFSTDVNERFRLDSVRYSIFKIEKFDSLTNCYVLSSNFDTNNFISGAYVLGVKLGVKWVSLEHEGIKSIFNKTQYDKGHPDRIDSISFSYNNELKNSDIISPSKIIYFKINDTTLQNHSLATNPRCYQSNKTLVLSEFIHWYNNLSKKDKHLEDFTFYNLTPSDALAFYNKKIKINYYLSGNKRLVYPN